MRRRSRLACLCWTLLVTLGADWPTADAKETQSPELMLFEEIPMVVTSTRTERSLRDVPSAVTVITSEEIRASGATSLQQLLATVPGLDLMRTSRGDLNLASRGFVAPSSSSLLVMIDGRSVYLDFFGVAIWEQLNVTLQDIERIEVVRGPGSALYGANAFAGTVNIVTKDARDLPRLHVQGGGGPDIGLVTATGAMSSNRLALKGSVQYRSRDEFRHTNTLVPNKVQTRHDTGPRSRLFNATAEYTTRSGTELRFSGGVSRTHGDTLTGIGTYFYDGPISYAQVNIDRGPWRAQAFHSNIDFDLDTVVILGPLTPGSGKLETSVTDFELQRTLAWGGHEVLGGLNVRRLSTDSALILGDEEEETLYAGFLQDVFQIADHMTGFLSVRLDEHPKSGFQASPRAALVYKVGETGRIRASWARSFKNPTHIFNYSSYAASPFVTLAGNDDLDPVWMTAYEFGGEVEPWKGLRVSADLFLNTIEDWQTFVVVAPGPPVVASFVNSGRAKIWGGELALEWRWKKALSGFGSYSYQSVTGDRGGVTPRHKGVLGLRGSLPGRLRYALTGNWVGHSDVDVDGVTVLTEFDIRSRFTVDGYVGFEVRDGVELGLHARNLFHQVRSHHPLGDDIGSEVLGTVTVEF